MKSKMTMTGAADLLSTFAKLQTQVPKEAIKALQDGAKDIQSSAQDFAPHDLGNLEEAVKIEERRSPGSITIQIGVDDAHPVPEKPGKTVGDYAMRMHEGDYNLGPASREKALAKGVEVGRKYLERALDEHKEEIVESIAVAVNRAAK